MLWEKNANEKKKSQRKKKASEKKNPLKKSAQCAVDITPKTPTGSFKGVVWSKEWIGGILVNKGYEEA